MTRTEAREFMMQIFFQMEAGSDFDINSRASYMSRAKLHPQEEYCSELYSLLCNKKEEIDSKINEYSIKWNVRRMPKTDLAVLRLAICEILYLSDLPAAVSINEAVELAKKYGTEDSTRYINAILGRIAAENEAADA